METKKENVIILGAAGRDFHDFNVYWKKRKDVHVVCFTAKQIPHIAGRTYPKELAGDDYPDGIPIFDQDEISKLIADHQVTCCALAYSDLSYNYVMSLGSKVNVMGANYVMLSPQQTMIQSRKPVISVCAVRTGCGKSQTSRWVVQALQELGKKAVVVRHPMPYGDLLKQRCQRYASVEDLDKYECTIEEREEYEQHILQGTIVYAGVDYEMILREAEKECDFILWDGGNNDTSFYVPTLAIVITDPLRAGHEKLYYPSEVNVRLADVILVNKVNSAKEEDVKKVKASLKEIVPNTPVLLCDSKLTPSLKGKTDEESMKEASKLVKGKKVLCIDDGPTLTHGGMPYGAAFVLAKSLGGKPVDPKPFAKGELQDVFNTFRHLEHDLPAMGYGQKQLHDLQETISAISKHVDTILIGTPIDLSKIVKMNKPVINVRYKLEPHQPDILKEIIRNTVEGKSHKAAVKQAKEMDDDVDKHLKQHLSKMQIGKGKPLHSK